METARQTGAALRYPEAQLTADRGPVLKVVRSDGRASQYAAAVLHARELVREAVRQRGRASENAAAMLHTDRELLRIAVRQDGTALHYAARELRACHGELRQAAASVIVPRQNSRPTASPSWRPCGRLGPHCDMPWQSSRRTASPS
jgi:hypothetical protein